MLALRAGILPGLDRANRVHHVHCGQLLSARRRRHAAVSCGSVFQLDGALELHPVHRLPHGLGVLDRLRKSCAMRARHVRLHHAADRVRCL